jgi:hypothetical protein
MSVTKSIIKRKTNRVSMITNIAKSSVLISSHHFSGQWSFILWINGTHMAHKMGSNQLRPTMLLIPLDVARFLNRTVDFSLRYFFFIDDDADVVDGEVFPDVGVVADATVVAVFMDNFFMDDEDGIDDFLVAAGEKIVAVCISSSDWMMRMIATRVDEPRRRTAVRVELMAPYQSWNERILLEID